MTDGALNQDTRVCQNMFDTYTLSAPFLELEFDAKPANWFIAVFYIVAIALLLVFLYAYAVVLPAFIGFETTVLVGIGLVALGVSR